MLVLMLPKLSPRARLSTPWMPRRLSRDWEPSDSDCEEGGDCEECGEGAAAASGGSGCGGGRLMLNGQSNPDSDGAVGEGSGDPVEDSRESCEPTDGRRCRRSAVFNSPRRDLPSTPPASLSPSPMRGEMTSP